jgi:hypothetical protein
VLRIYPDDKSLIPITKVTRVTGCNKASTLALDYLADIPVLGSGSALILVHKVRRGLLNLSIIYFLHMDLRHSSWLLEQKNETEPMFLSFFIPVGVFLLIAARRPSEHRSMIALAAWWNISHGSVMAMETVEAWIHGVHRRFTDVSLFLVIGVVLFSLLPAKRKAVAPGVA